MIVAALYVDPRGPYPRLPDVECWDETRDARLYDGPHPVVAHPPCTHYGKLRHMARRDDADCAPIAVDHVRRYGGVLEHPAHSLLWDKCAMARPGEQRDEYGGYTLVVTQVSWGHVARKLTWLYFVDVDSSLVAHTMRTGGEPTHWISGGRGRVGKKAKTTPVPPGIKVCSAQQRRRTPLAFAEWLVMLARSVRP